ncbi:hypothetical protein QBC31_43075 [Streptomyces sp. B21-079]|uniref:hypothetical protein n=1 Tax=Streptomyces sp. B21-079 TaxID=3039409 RepID=UPI002FF427AC
MWPLEAFYVHDDTTAVVETLTGGDQGDAAPAKSPTTPRRSPASRRWAVYGDAARALIQAAMDALE